MKINHKVVMTGSESQTSMKMLFDVAPPAPPQRAKIGRAGDPGRLRFGLRQCGVGLILRLSGDTASYLSVAFSREGTKKHKEVRIRARAAYPLWQE